MGNVRMKVKTPGGFRRAHTYICDFALLFPHNHLGDGSQRLDGCLQASFDLVERFLFIQLALFRGVLLEGGADTNSGFGERLWTEGLP